MNHLIILLLWNFVWVATISNKNLKKKKVIKGLGETLKKKKVLKKNLLKESLQHSNDFYLSTRQYFTYVILCDVFFFFGWFFRQCEVMASFNFAQLCNYVSFYFLFCFMCEWWYERDWIFITLERMSLNVLRLYVCVHEDTFKGLWCDMVLSFFLFECSIYSEHL